MEPSGDSRWACACGFQCDGGDRKAAEKLHTDKTPCKLKLHSATATGYFCTGCNWSDGTADRRDQGNVHDPECLGWVAGFKYRKKWVLAGCEVCCWSARGEYSALEEHPWDCEGTPEEFTTTSDFPAALAAARKAPPRGRKVKGDVDVVIIRGVGRAIGPPVDLTRAACTTDVGGGVRSVGDLTVAPMRKQPIVVEVGGAEGQVLGAAIDLIPGDANAGFRRCTKAGVVTMAGAVDVYRLEITRRGAAPRSVRCACAGCRWLRGRRPALSVVFDRIGLRAGLFRVGRTLPAKG